MKKYYISFKSMQVKLTGLVKVLFFLIVISQANAQTGSNCQNAINLNIHNCEEQTLVFSASEYSKWFSFKADSSQELIVIRGHVGVTYAQINSVNFYSGNCSNLSPIYSYTLNPLDSQSITRPLIDLIRSHTYYIKVNYSSTTNPAQISICKAPLNRTEASCSSGCTIVGETFTDLANITTYCHSISEYVLENCQYYLNPFVVSGTASGGTIPSFVPCWTDPPWGSPQIMHSSVSNSDYAFMWSQQSNSTGIAGESIAIKRTFNANSIYILKYDYSTGGTSLDNCFVDLLPVSTPIPTNGVFPTTFVGATYWSGGIPIDNMSSINESTFITRQLSFTVPTTVTRKLTFYPWVNPSTTTPYIEQYLDIDNVMLYEVTAVPTASSKTLTCAGTTTLNANPCASAPAGAVTYSWAPASGLSSTTGTTVTASPSVTTIYTLTATSGTCSVSGTITITVPPTPPCPVISGSLCANASNTLTISNADPTVIYNWSPAVTYVPGNTSHSTVIINNPTANTVYTVTAIYANCAGNGSKSVTTNTCCTCSSTISVNPAPYNPTFSGTFCPGQTITINSPDNMSDNYIWNPSVNCLNSNCSQVITSTSTIYTVTAINPSLSCQSISTIYINPAPPLSVTPTTTTICSGTSVTLNMSSPAPFFTHEWSTNIGTICQPCNNTVVSPLTTTTYTASVVGANGCAASQPVIVNVNPTPTVSINDNPVPLICTQNAGSSAILNATSTIPYFSWAPATGLNNTSIPNPTATPTSTTIYTLTSTDPNTGCFAQDTITVFVENCLCTKNAYRGITINNGNATALNTVVEHSFNHPVTTISGAVTFTNQVFYFAPNCALVVPNGSSLTLKHCHLLACTDMWQGIIVQPGGKLIVQDSSMIEDAFAAISCHNWNASATTNSLTVDGCVFNRNDTAISISSYTYTAVFPATIRNAVFTSRTLATTVTSLPPFGYGWRNYSTPQKVKTTVAVSSNLQTPYRLAHTTAWVGANLKNPMSSVVANYGICLNGVGWSNTNGTTTLPTTYYGEVNIGDATNTASLNLFDNLYYGIYALTSNFTCLNNAFENMHSYPTKVIGGTPYVNAGTAIYAQNGLLTKHNWFNRARIIYPGYSPSINPNTNSTNYYTPSYNNKFYDCVTAINTQSYQEVHVAGTDIRSTQTNTTLPISITPPAGKYGILVNSPAYTYNYFRYNLITNISNGIVFTAGVASNNTQSLGRVSADYNNITAYFNNLPTTQFVNNAIALDNSLNCYSISTGASSCQRNSYFWVSANKNNIQNVYKGIEMTNWIGWYNSRKIPYNISADTNYISLIQTSGVYNSSTPSTQFGINANHCYLHEINLNNIYGMQTVLASKDNIRGVYPKDDAESTVQCNQTTNVGRGFDFEGQSTGTFGTNDYASWFNNTMQNNGKGFALTANCILGQQGDLSYSSDNQWTGSWTGSNFGTYVDAASNALNSALYVQSGSSPYYPQNNGSANPFYDYVSVGAITTGATPSGNVCGTLPQAPCTRCVINGRTIAERVVQDSLTFPLLAAQSSYRAQLKYYRMIALNDSVADSSVVLQNFYAANQSSNLGAITNIESSLAQGDIATAQNINSSLAPANIIEVNYQKVYTAAINYADSTYTSSDSSNLYQIASACPAINGDIVYSARAMYNAIYNQYQYFEDNCNYDSLYQTSNARLSKKANTEFTSVAKINASSSNNLLVYPNPSTGDVFISSSDLQNTVWTLIVTDVTGRTVIENNYPVNNNLVKISTQLTNGVYFVKVIMPNGSVKQQKVIIAK